MFFLLGCQGIGRGELSTVDYVDIDRFMGDWYVIASIPTPFERDAFNAIEHYALDDDGRVATTFSFNRGGFEGPRKKMNATGFIEDTATNAVWGMQFLWPFKADYRVVYLDESYSTTIIGRNQRDYVWIMARSPHMDDAVLERHLAWLAEQGYAVERVAKVPQRWPAP